MEEKIIGKIVNTFQLKGALKVTISTERPEERFKVGKKIFIKTEDEKIEHTIVSIRMSNPKVAIIKIDGIDDINKAEKYIDCDVVQEVNEEENSFFYDDLLSCEVITADKRVIGKVNKIIRMRNIDYLLVDNFYIPFQLDIFISSVDKEKKQIEITELAEETMK